jgi:F0F1-type ATP synthase delta subunit
MSKITKRELAARFVDLLGAQPLADLCTATMQIAVEAGYARDLPSVVAAIEQELQQRSQAVEVRLTTARELPAAIQRTLAAAVAKEAGAEQYSVTHQVDPAILGGFEATAGDTVVRGSIRSNLVKLGVS